MPGHIDAGGPEVIACPVRRALRLTCQDWAQRLPFVQHEVKEGCHPRSLAQIRVCEQTPAPCQFRDWSQHTDEIGFSIAEGCCAN